MEVNTDLQNDVIIKWYIDRNLPPVNANHILLKQVFINLYKNACEAMKSSKAKAINVYVKIHLLQKGKILVEFTDTGKGIPDKILPKIFEYGVTTKGKKGSGVGLNQAKLIIEKFGGDIKVESGKDKGTNVSITLPIWKESAEDAD